MTLSTRPALAGLFALSLTAFAGQALADDLASVVAGSSGVFATTGPADVGPATVVFDNISAFQSGNASAVVTATSSAPNTFMGAAYTLVPGTTSITGFDIYPVNLSGTNFVALKGTIYVWGGVNTGTVSAANPAFSNLLGTYTVTSTGDFQTGFFYSFESAALPGIEPGISLATPLSIPGTTIGLTFNYQGSTDGTTFTNVQSLTSLISYGVPATVGAQLGNGYYRNGAGETNGNFNSGLRSLGFTDQSLAVRVYTAPVPEPGTWLMMALGLGVLALGAARRR